MTLETMLQELETAKKPLDIVTTTDGYSITLSDVKPEDIKRVGDHLNIEGSNYDVQVKISLDIRKEVTENATVYTLTYCDTLTSFLLIDHY